MRKLLITVLSVCLLISCGISVCADVIWEPYNDAFFEKHRSEMQYEGRNYKMTKDTYFFSRPDGRQLDEMCKADETVSVQYLYQAEDGQLWGVCSRAKGESVWLNLNGSIRPYDRTDFTADYASEFKEMQTQPDASFYENEVLLYDYPGAKNSLSALYVPDNADYLPEYTHTYTDPAGNVWAELHYYMIQNGWVMLSGDPATATLPEKAVDTVIGTLETQSEPTPSAAQQDSDRKDADTINYSVPVILVCAVVAVTLAVLFVFLKKK